MTSVLPPLKEPTKMNALLTGEKKKAFPLSTWGGAQTMVTSYSMDFGKKEGKPAEARPCSATRRNRPHPSQYFMNWRVPSKPILDGKSAYTVKPQKPQESEYSSMLQNFSEEYKGKDEPKQNGPSSNICKEITAEEKLKLMERLKISGKPVETFQLPFLPLNPEAWSIVADLLKKATPQEQEVLEKAFSDRDKDSQELPPYAFISPEAIRVLEQVLQKAGITDNDSAIRFLLSIGQVLMSISNSNCRATPRPRLPTDDRERRRALRSPPVHSPSFCMPKHRDDTCALCNKSNLTNELRDISEKKILDKSKLYRSYLENVPRLPKIRAPKRSTMARGKPWHNMPNYPPQGKVENKLATFVLPHRPIPRSFTIHPEWD